MPAGGRHLCLLVYGLTGGGVPRLTVALAAELARRGWSVDVAVLDPRVRQPLPAPAPFRMVRVNGWLGSLPWTSAKRKRQYRLAPWGFARYLRRARPDLVLAADIRVDLIALQAREATAATCPVVVSVHNSLTYLEQHKPHYLDGIRAHFPRADATVAVSEGIAAQLRAAGVPAARVHFMPNPVIGEDFEPMMDADTPAFDFDHGDATIIAVGRLMPQKDFGTLLRAFQRLLAGRPRARLVIVGEGPDRDTLARLTEGLKIDGSVHFAGAVPVALPYIARADLLVLSSVREGMPTVLIEALACGTPVVSTDCDTGPADILAGGEFGALVPVGDWAALAEAMDRALDGTAPRDRLRERGRQFTTKRSADAYESLFQTLLAVGPGGVRPAA